MHSDRRAKVVRFHAFFCALLFERNFPDGLRGYSLYLHQKEGLCRSLASRQ